MTPSSGFIRVPSKIQIEPVDAIGVAAPQRAFFGRAKIADRVGISLEGCVEVREQPVGGEIAREHCALASEYLDRFPDALRDLRGRQGTKAEPKPRYLDRDM